MPSDSSTWAVLRVVGDAVLGTIGEGAYEYDICVVLGIGDNKLCEISAVFSGPAPVGISCVALGLIRELIAGHPIAGNDDAGDGNSVGNGVKKDGPDIIVGDLCGLVLFADLDLST